VRSEEEFAAAHVRDAKNIPLAALKERMAEIDKWKDRPVITVCARDAQSGKAAALLRKQGFGQASSLLGGLSAWRSQGLPVASKKKEQA